MDQSQTGRRRSRPTLVLFDPLSAPSPTKPGPPTGLSTLAEHDDDEFDDNESFFSALGDAKGFPIEGGSLVGELVATSPERPAATHTTAAASEHDRPAVDLMSWESPVKPSSSSQPSAAGSSDFGGLAAKVPLPASPPPSSPSSFDFLAPTPRPTSKLMATSTLLAQARRVPLPESPPRRQNVMDWLAETPMPTRRVVASPSAVARRAAADDDFASSPAPPQLSADNTAATLAPFEIDESYEDLLQTPAPRKPRAFVASANVTAFVSPTSSSTLSCDGPLGQLPALNHRPQLKSSPLDQTTVLPSAPNWEDDEADDDLMRTPAPKKVRNFAFARPAAAAADESTFPSLPAAFAPSTSRSAAPASAPLADSSMLETTTFLPATGNLADESYADLLSTPAPRQVRTFALAADTSAFSADTSFASSTSSTSTVAAGRAGSAGLADAEETTFLPAMDASYDDLMATPAPQRVIVFSAADVSVFPSLTSSVSSTVNGNHARPAETQDGTTVLPHIPADLDESFNNLMTTPAPRRVQKLGPDASTFPSPPAMADLGASTASSASSTSTVSLNRTTTNVTDRDELDQTGFWPANVGADETYDDLMTTQAPRRVKTLSVSPPSAPALTSPPPSTEPPRDSASLEARFGYLLASTRGAPRTPVAADRMQGPADVAVDNDDESFDLGALKGVSMGDETFDLLSTPLPSLAQSRTSNFPRSSSASPTPLSAPSPALTEEDGDETLILSSKAFDLQDESFSLLSGSRPTGLGDDDDEADDWGLEEEREIQTLMAADSRLPALSTPVSKVKQIKAAVPLAASSESSPIPAASARPALRELLPVATSSSSAMHRASSAGSPLAPRASLTKDAPTPSVATSAVHRRPPSLAGKDLSVNRAGEQTSTSLRRTSTIGSLTPRRTVQAPAPINTAQRRLSGIPAPPSTAPNTTGRDAHATPGATRSARPSVVRPPAPPPAASATPSQARHRRTSSVPVNSTPLLRSASAARLNAAFANARTPIAAGRTPLVGLNSTVNAAPTQPEVDVKLAPSPAKTLNRKDGTRSLNSSLSSTSNSSLSALSERVSSSRLHSRSLYALPGSASSSSVAAAPTVLAGSRLPRQTSSLASGIRAPTATAGSKPVAGPAPTLESVRAALASLEARRRK